MRITTNSTETLEWDLETVTAVGAVKNINNEYTFGSFKAGVGGSDNYCVDIPNEEVLRDVHKAIGNLIDHLDRKRGVGNIQSIVKTIGYDGDGNEIPQTFTSGHDSIQ